MMEFQNLYNYADGVYRPATYATRKGLEYIRKMLSKERKVCAAN